jgi:hypothetical protein
VLSLILRGSSCELKRVLTGLRKQLCNHFWKFVQKTKLSGCSQHEPFATTVGDMMAPLVNKTHSISSRGECSES